MAKTVEVKIQQVGPSVSQGIARSHTVLIDRPVDKGGEDRGPLGGEYLLIAIGGCFMSNLLAAIRARTAAISDVQIRVSGDIDGTPERFTVIRLKVTAKVEDSDLMQKLITIAERACVVSNTLRDSVSISIVFE